MAFGIIVYENDSYLYSLIKERLASVFPQAYIDRGGNPNPSFDIKLINCIKILYDNKDFPPPDTHDRDNIIPLYSDDGKGHMIIDMKIIFEKISSGAGSGSSKTQSDTDYKDRLKLLISYAYIDERENFIRLAIGPSSFDTIHPIRIDLMSGIRMPNVFTKESSGSITGLLKECSDIRFEPGRILDYLNPDSNGFLSAGKPEHEDDVFDIGIRTCSRLMALLKTLCVKNDTGALVVAEGWRESELLELIGYCDTLHILLPARMCTEDTGMTKELGLFKRSLPSGSLMTVHYCEDYKENYETIRI